MKNTITVLGISGSIRSNYKNIDKLQSFVEEADTPDELNAKIYNSKLMFANSDLTVAHALLGAKQNGATIRLISITKLFEHKNQNLYENLITYETVDDIGDIDTLSINEYELQTLLQNIEQCNGILLSTPVYFGDRSSVANKLLQLTNKKKLLKNKAFGVLSIGAKRNGGQETTNIYTLYEAMMQEAIVIGNGPKTSQYGGTVHAGDLNKAIEDSFGMETSYGTGRQVAQLSKLLQPQVIQKNEKLNITILITMDSNKKYESIVEKYFEVYNNHNITLYNLTDSNIYRCVSCSVCPSPKLREKYIEDDPAYNCIVQTSKDSMREIQDLMFGSDCIVIAGANSNDDLIYRYQAFLERTRFIRRNDFELTNIPVIGLLVNELDANNNPLHNVKVLTSFIRHNSIILKPLQLTYYNDKEIYIDDFSNYLDTLLLLKQSRQTIEPLEISYKATGYSDKSLDHTSKIRR